MLGHDLLDFGQGDEGEELQVAADVRVGAAQEELVEVEGRGHVSV